MAERKTPIESSGAATTLWLETALSPNFSPLKSDASADVCVIGAGIAGLTVAYRLLKDHRTVIVLDDGKVGGGETGRTSAHLSNALDDRYHLLEKLHGERGARHAAESHTAAIDFIERTVHAEGIDCEFRRVDGFLVRDRDDNEDVLLRERDAARRVGLAGVDFVPRAPWMHYDTGRALRFPNQAQFHPLKYLYQLAAIVKKAGGRLHCGTRAAEVKDGVPAIVKTADGRTVRAAAVVVATNVPFNDRVAMHTKQAAYRTYVIGARVPADAAAEALYWDTPEPYHYVRFEDMADNRRERLLIVGGEDHKTGQADPGRAPYEKLLHWTQERFPVNSIAHEWSGQVVEPVDGMAFIGRNPGERNVYIVTGDSGNGLTHGTIAGLLIPDLIAGRTNDWSELYDPDRKPPVRAIKDYLHENLNVGQQYMDWLKIRESLAAKAIAPGSGKVVQSHGEKLAVYRDEKGEVHACSAVCPHLGCIVRWNSNEKSWDCPCHGSRFNPDGKVQNGPSSADLAPAKSAVSRQR